MLAGKELLLLPARGHRDPGFLFTGGIHSSHNLNLLGSFTELLQLLSGIAFEFPEAMPGICCLNLIAQSLNSPG